MSSLYLLHKPYHMLSQFTDHSVAGVMPRATLADIITVPNIYAAGRLDYDSEGLLLLSDDGQLIHRIADPRHKQPKVYRLQVEGCPDDASLQTLRHGVTLKDGQTRPTKIRRLTTSGLAERDPPLDPKRHAETQWLEMTLTEGRNRQVRRMLAHVGHPVLRLVRVAIGPWQLDDMAPGEWRREVLHVPRPVAAHSKRSPAKTPRPKRRNGERR
ncbi:pseudouridine synthase [Halomonas sp. TRM85114]|uniref:pseudouridine synthase n=1 Tax=Halomonas jincaotanensis TaxID=2810616 RepID=UPI001BD63604|nr:pseudouridine synthase [Halomonas jincaotanensis]MBS9404444.1 pseudouridine synthase [Halomonas jincaotanensis]